MSDILALQKDSTFSVFNDNDHEYICKISRALSIPERVKILQSILKQSKSLSEIAEELQMPISSVARHVDILADAQIIFVNYLPGPKGHTKFCAQAIVQYTISLDSPSDQETAAPYTVELPLGLFSHCHIKAPCGMNAKDHTLNDFDNPNIFFYPERVQAESLWFDQGFISYNFPTPNNRKRIFQSISFSFEICSETAYYNNNWPSDITISINNLDIITFTSEGDFGGRRGKYTPDFWPITSTQFGKLKTVTVNEKGVYLDNVLQHKNFTFNDLKIFNGNAIQLTIGIKDDAIHKGGINLFGKNFGDFPQSIVMTMR